MIMNKQTKIIRKKYDRFSKFYDFFERSIEGKKFGIWRRKLLGNLKGNILEVGVGTGKNLKYYNPYAKVIGIDLSPKMLDKAREKLEIINNPNIRLLEMDAQTLDFPDNKFDYVVNTFVLCQSFDKT